MPARLLAALILALLPSAWTVAHAQEKPLQAELVLEAAPDPLNDPAELRRRLMEAYTELRAVVDARESAMRRFLAVSAVTLGGAALLLLVLYRQKCSAICELNTLNKRLAENHQDLQRAHKQLEQLNREMNEVLSVVSHDLRNPLAGIEALARETKEDLHNDGNETASGMLRLMEDSARRMLSLVTNLLDVQRIEAGHHGLSANICDLTELAQDVIREQHDTATRKGQQLIFEGPEEVLAVGDEIGVQRVISNLVSNAIKYSSPGTAITIQVIEGNRPGIAVSDQGRGIRPEDMPKLFRKFSRVGMPTAGESSTGLGLAISRGIIEALKGRIWCESVVGRGSTFRFELQPFEPARLQQVEIVEHASSH